MPDFRQGLTEAMGAAQNRAYSQEAIDAMKERQAALRRQEEQDRKDREAAQEEAAQDKKFQEMSLKAIKEAMRLQQADSAPTGPQPPMPGQGSQPMTQGDWQPGAGGPPSPMGGGTVAGAMQGGMPQGSPPPMPMAQSMAMPKPPAAMTPNFTPSPASMGAPPPGPPPPAAGMPPMPGGAPPGSTPKELPPQWLSVPKAIEAMDKVGVPAEQQYKVLAKMMPVINAQNKEALDELKATTEMSRAIAQTIKEQRELMKAGKAQSAYGKQLEDEGLAPGSPEFASRMDEHRKKQDTLTRAQGGAGGKGGGAGGGSAVGLTDDALNDLADQFNATGQLPAMYRDQKGREKIMNRAAERRRAGETSDLAGNRAGFKADAASLVQRQRFVDTGNQFVKNMQAQADLVEQYMNKGTAGGIPALNKWIQAGRKQIAGDPDVTALDTAIRGLAREHQRIVTGVTSNAQLHVAAQQTADELLNVAQTPAQIRAALKVMREEATNAVKAGKDEVAEIRSRMKGGKDGGGDDLKSKVEAAGERYEPDKYDYRVTADGKVQRKLKGS